MSTARSAGGETATGRSEHPGGAAPIGQGEPGAPAGTGAYKSGRRSPGARRRAKATAEITPAASPYVQEAGAALAERFRYGGCIRYPDLVRRQLFHQTYHRGWEFRLAADTPRELEQVRQLLRQAGFRPAKPFLKRGRILQPVYGKKAVERFKSLIDADEEPPDGSDQ
ncbi:MAG TPA: hypothetical protein VFJ58_03440 [Armatimonadota bacterium]|nr:hypothetical protein [Armatimonadota bacterium]